MSQINSQRIDYMFNRINEIAKEMKLDDATRLRYLATIGRLCQDIIDKQNTIAGMISENDADIHGGGPPNA